MKPSLVALDWGTTNLRAVLMGESGQALAVRTAELGILRITDGDFEGALMSVCGDWLAEPNRPLMASGMIGSRQGWREAQYLPAPASADSASASLVAIRLHGGQTLHLIAGVSCISPEGIDDVMRGEETQIWGAALPDGAVAVLPGTHSKWVRCGPLHAIDTFRTWMTGELYSTLSAHTILGRLMDLGGHSSAAFELGVRRALDDPATLGALLFSVRTAGLMGRLEPRALPDYLSGLLIGAEISSGRQQFLTNDATPVSREVQLIGEPALCQRYASALAIAGVSSRVHDSGLAAHGAWRIARAAGLLDRQPH